MACEMRWIQEHQRIKAQTMALLEVKNLSISFHTRNGVTKAVDDVSFSVASGETLAMLANQAQESQ